MKFKLILVSCYFNAICFKTLRKHTSILFIKTEGMFQIDVKLKSI